MPDRCPYHEQTRKELADLGVSVAHLQEKQAANESEAESMKTQLERVCSGLSDVQYTINRWTWTSALLVAGGGIVLGILSTLIGLAVEFRVPLARLLGGL